MDLEFRKIMETENDEDLFFFFKSDGSLNFEKKIIAGKILHERDFDNQKLVDEKNKIIKSINDIIGFYTNPTEFAEKKKKEKRNAILFGIFGNLIILGLYIYWYLHSDNENENWLIFAILFFSGVIILYLFRIKAKVPEINQEEKDDLELQKERLQIINNEWNFN
jgi:hypothetical protein